jgi:hypothetical protein
VSIGDSVVGPLYLETLHPDVRSFYEFGRFVNQFAIVEWAYKFLFHRVCGLSEDIARSIIGSMQIGNAMALLNRVVKASALPDERKQELQSLIDQTNAIAGLRDPLVHRGVSSYATGLISSNFMTAKSRAGVEPIVLNMRDLQAATSDLEAITVRLFLFDRPDEIERHFHRQLYEPWRYKHTSLGSQA